MIMDPAELKGDMHMAEENNLSDDEETKPRGESPYATIH